MTASPQRAESIRLSGIVQGVGMRPMVFRLAQERGLCGSVRNDGGGVHIVVFGAAHRIDDFVRAIELQAPPLARIDRILRAACTAPTQADFRIDPSQADAVQTELSPDAYTCSACLAEVFDPSHRRWRHAFANCTHCGPRFSIIGALPYDRARTSMAGFAMCAACEREYRNPADRRFHAQPIACPSCGPQMRAERADSAQGTPDAHQVPHLHGAADAIRIAAQWLRDGRIVAVKGIGGYQLACDAGCETAVARLRNRKQRPAKALALLARDVAMVERHCRVSPLEAALLQSAAAPIVLLWADGSRAVAASVAPRQRMLGFMLPPSALHHLLMAELDGPLVLTSGNRADEPQCCDDDDARAQLGAIADGFLLHDRAILNRVDDSVLRVVAGVPRVLRRGRGLAPATLPLPPGFERAAAVLALGGQMKNTICLTRDGRAMLSQHIGELDNPRAYAAFRHSVALYQQLFEHRPAIIAVDRHPDFRASRLGRDLAAAQGLALVEVQHHHAHVAACMAEHRLALAAGAVLGVALDGLGWGDDGTLWGGEFLRADYGGFERLAWLRPVPMPGGTQAIVEPWRMAWAHLAQQPAFNEWCLKYANLPFFQQLRGRPLRTLQAMQRAGINSPLTSSCGRLFDAVAALSGICASVSYDGQAAIELEACVDAAAMASGEAYPFALSSDQIDAAPLWPALLDDLARGLAAGAVAARFHLGLEQAILAMVESLTQRHADPWQHRVVLAGGVFQNARLLAGLTARLEAAGYAVLSSSRVPCNDGGLAFGQAVVAAASALQARPLPGLGTVAQS